jgi:predicted ATPase
MRLLTPDQILARLPGQLEHPGALADLPGRQQTLTSTIQWSYNLLPEPAQQMLARLSVFDAPFTAAAAEAVGGLPATSLDSSERSTTSGGQIMGRAGRSRLRLHQGPS